MRENEEMEPTPKRRWLRFSLRGLLVSIAAIAIWLGIQVNRAHKQRDSVAELQRAGAVIFYDYHHRPEMAEAESFRFDPTAEPPISPWLVQLIGQEYFSRVEGLDFGSLNVDPRAIQIAQLQDIRFLILERTLANDDDLRNLAQLSQLEELDLRHTDVTDAGLSYAHHWPELVYLNLAFTEIGNAGCSHLTALRELKSLTLQGTRVTDEALRSVAYCTNLEFLDLSKTSVTDEGLSHLAPLQKLSHIELANCEYVSDAAMPKLKVLGSLQKIGLSGPLVREAGTRGTVRDY
jgi:hypothetical protein